MARPSFGGEHSCAGGPRAAVSPRVAVSPLCAGSPRAPVGPRPAKNRIVNGFSVVSRISLHDAAISLSPSPSPTGSVLVRHRRPGWPMFRAGEVGSVAASHTATVKDLSVLGRKSFTVGSIAVWGATWLPRDTRACSPRATPATRSARAPALLAMRPRRGAPQCRASRNAERSHRPRLRSCPGDNRGTTDLPGAPFGRPTPRAPSIPPTERRGSCGHRRVRPRLDCGVRPADRGHVRPPADNEARAAMRPRRPPRQGSRR